MATDIPYVFVSLLVLIFLAVPFSRYMAKVFIGKRTFLTPVIRPIEVGVYRLCRIDESEEMSWKKYAVVFLLFNGIGLIVLFLLQLSQGRLPFNPQGFGPVRWDTALNTAISFVTNTSWQSYGGETTMSYLTQMLGVTVQDFLSSAIGIAVLLPLIRAFTHKFKTTSAISGSIRRASCSTCCCRQAFSWLCSLSHREWSRPSPPTRRSKHWKVRSR